MCEELRVHRIREEVFWHFEEFVDGELDGISGECGGRKGSGQTISTEAAEWWTYSEFCSRSSHSFW